MDTSVKNICICSSILLFLAIFNFWPYNFYIILRWIIFFVSVYMVNKSYKSKVDTWTIVFCALAITFNPIIPLYLTKSNWIIIDVIGSVLFFITANSKKSIK